jgi:glycerol-3-phosphate dehydrogenase
MKIYDVIIIGAGVVGTAIARQLSRYELKTALLEKEEELAFGVSKSNSGIIHPGTQNPPDSLKGKLCVQGNRLVRRISRDLGVDFKEVGELIVALDENDIPRLLKLKEDARKLGVPGVKIVKPPWLKTHEPNLSGEVRAALYAPTAGIISPYRLTYDMAENARKNGVEIVTRAEVVDIKADQGGGSDAERFFEVVTAGGGFRARYVINAAGLFADDIASMVGVRDFRITPRRGQEFILDRKKENLARHLIFPLPTEKSKGTLIIKTADGNPMIGPTAEDCDDKTDLSTTGEGLERVVASVRKMMPSINPADIIAYFSGLRPVAGHDFIIRHEDAVPGFVNVAGIQSPGLTAAPAIAVMVKDLLAENGLPLKKKKVFHKYREKTVHLFSLPLAKTERLIKKDPAYGDIVCRCEMVSAKEIKEAINRGARTMDGIKFRTRAQAGRCHGGFCTTRIMKMLAQAKGVPLTEITKKGPGSEIIIQDRAND